jgi:hypothetical protein
MNGQAQPHLELMNLREGISQQARLARADHSRQDGHVTILVAADA